MKKEKYCIKCGAVLPEEASFCPCCTASQMERRSVVAPPPNGGRKRRRVWLCAALALLLAGAGSGMTTVLIQRVYNLLTYGGAARATRCPPGPRRRI